MIPKYNEMYNDVLNVMINYKELSLKALVNLVSDAIHLTVNERNELMLNKKTTVIYDRIGWTKAYLSKAGLVETVKRGVYKLSDEGIKVVQSKVQVNNQYLMRYPSFSLFFVLIIQT